MITTNITIVQQVKPFCDKKNTSFTSILKQDVERTQTQTNTGNGHKATIQTNAKIMLLMYWNESVFLRSK